jgi:hypothetical protein
MERVDLMACIEEPVAELDARSEKAAICVAIRGSMQFSQVSAIERVGVIHCQKSATPTS